MADAINVISRTQTIVVDRGAGAVAVINAGPVGPAGPGMWMQMTQAAYDALPVKDPDTLYVIVG